MDHRELAAAMQGTVSADHERMTVSTEVESDDGTCRDVTLRCEYVVCGVCGGRGAHVNPAIDSHGISPDEFADDPDFAEGYHSGRYDVPCAGCNGRRVTLTPLPDNDAADLAAFNAAQQGAAEAAAEYETQQRLGY